MKRASLFLALGMMSAGIPAGGAHAASASVLSFHDAKTSREWSIVDKLYGPYVSAHKDVKMETAVADLDGKGVGSVFVRFISGGTCTASGSCLTNMIHYDQKTKQWQESFSHHAKEILVSAVSMKHNGLRYVYTDDHIRWEWNGFNAYRPDVTSVGTPWPDAKEASGSRKKFALENGPSIFPSDIPVNTVSGIDVTEIPLSLSGIGTQYALVYESGVICAPSGGCPFIIVDGNDRVGYTVKGHGTYNFDGATMRNTETGPQYAPFAVQDNAGIAFYAYNNGQYGMVKTTWPSAVTRSP